MNNFLDEKIENQKDKHGLYIKNLKSGTKLTIETTNSFYEIEVLDPKQVLLFGGSLPDGKTRFPKPIKAYFHGSTWGGSAIMLDWLGKDMRLEFSLNKNQILTTSY